MKQPIAITTGGQGTLGQAIKHAFTGSGIHLLSPSKYELDVTSKPSIEAYFQHLNQLDLMICNAGVIDDTLLATMSESSWDKVIDINLKGAFLATKAAAHLMCKQQHGHIIFISSFAALHPSFGQASYASAKSGLIGLAKSLAQELGDKNIRVNVIIPGFMKTNMTASLTRSITASIQAKHTLKSLNTPENTANFIRFLHLEMPATSGQVFNLDSRIL